MEDEESVVAAEFGELSDVDPPVATADEQQRNLEMIFDVPVTVTAELGRTLVKVKDLINFSPGSVVELERVAGDSIDLLVNGVLIGKGDVVVVNDSFGIRVTEIVCTEERIKKLSD